MDIHAEVALGRAERRWGRVLLIEGGYKEPRPRQCPACGARYRPRKAYKWKGRKRVLLGQCALKHGEFRWP